MLVSARRVWYSIAQMRSERPVKVSTRRCLLVPAALWLVSCGGHTEIDSSAGAQGGQDSTVGTSGGGTSGGGTSGGQGNAGSGVSGQPGRSDQCPEARPQGACTPDQAQLTCAYTGSGLCSPPDKPCGGECLQPARALQPPTARSVGLASAATARRSQV
jgi:hypothetical protein